MAYFPDDIKRMRDLYSDEWERELVLGREPDERKLVRVRDHLSAAWDQESLTRAQPTGTASKASHGPNSKARRLQMSYTEGDYQDSRRLKFPKTPVYPRP